MHLGPVAELGLERRRGPESRNSASVIRPVSSSNSGCAPSRSAIACIARPSDSAGDPGAGPERRRTSASAASSARRRSPRSPLGSRAPAASTSRTPTPALAGRTAARAPLRPARRRTLLASRATPVASPAIRTGSPPCIAVELEPDPARQPSGPYSVESSASSSWSNASASPSAPATISSPWPAAPGGRSAATAIRRPSSSRAESDPQRLDLVPVELAGESPDRVLRRSPRDRARRARRRATRSAAARRLGSVNSSASDLSHRVAPRGSSAAGR